MLIACLLQNVLISLHVLFILLWQRTRHELYFHCFIYMSFLAVFYIYCFQGFYVKGELALNGHPCLKKGKYCYLFRSVVSTCANTFSVQNKTLLTHHTQIDDMSPNSVGWTLIFICIGLPVKFWAAQNLFITTCSPAPSLSYSLSRWLTCIAISCNTIHILLVSAGMLLTGDVPLILQVQRKTWPRFREPRWAFAPPTHSRRVFNGPHRGKRLTVCLHSGISELVLIIEPLSIQRHWSQPRCLFHRSLNLCRSPNVHYSSKLARGL